MKNFMELPFKCILLSLAYFLYYFLKKSLVIFTVVGNSQRTPKCIFCTDKFVKFKEDTILVFNYVANQKYPEGMSRDQKKEFRRKCKCYTIKDGVLYYVGFGKKGKKYI